MVVRILFSGFSRDGRLHDARDAHARNVPKGHEYILDDEPDYGGFLRAES